MINLPSTFYAIERDGLHRIYIEDDFIGPQTDLLSNLAKFVPRILPDIIKGTALMVNSTGFAMARRIDSLALHTYYRPMVDVHEKAVMVPVWAPPGSEIKCSWRPPEGMRLFFVQRWEVKDGATAVGVEPLNYLVAMHQETRRTYLLPIPNLHENAQICLGNAHLSSGTFSALEVLGKGVHLLQTSTWNTDLLRSVDRQTHALFRFDADGNQLPGEGDWTQWCGPVSNSNYEFIAKL